LERLRGRLYGYLPLRVRPGVEQAGGVEYLVLLAQEAPKTFVPLLIKTMPPECHRSLQSVPPAVESKCTTSAR